MVGQFEVLHHLLKRIDIIKIAIVVTIIIFKLEYFLGFVKDLGREVVIWAACLHLSRVGHTPNVDQKEENEQSDYEGETLGQHVDSVPHG